MTLPIQVSLVNQSTAFADSALPALANALQFQVIRDFFPAWGIEAKLFYTPTGKNPTVTHWVLALLDDADQAGALGYHDITPAGQPLGKVFVKTTLAAGQKVEVTASHELLEMLADPDVNLAGQDQQKFWAYEVGDPVENDEYQIVIPAGWNGAGTSVPVSNFALPSWWEGFRAAGPFDFLGKLTAPLTLTPGGYASFLNLANAGAGWQQVNGRTATPRLEARNRLRSRGRSGPRFYSTYRPAGEAIPVGETESMNVFAHFVPGHKTRAILQAIQTDLAEVKQELKTMGDAIQTGAAQVAANLATLTTAVSNIATGVLALDAELQKLAAQIAAGGTASQADIDVVNALVASSAALVTQVQGISTALPAGT